AHRGGLSTVVIPQENEKDLAEIPKNIKGALDIRPVRWIDDVLKIALQSMPEAKPAEPTEPGKPATEVSGGKTEPEGVRPH
ncbi:MAG TPA: S16 family serine protease, partial [Gammaproteobacteria bacterium]|nr:S16 family serine protease [Gammaproteobacteria bacterium]